jgi:hypothetical protein
VELPVKVDPAYGSIHTTIPVPKAAQPVQYQVTLKLPGSDAAVASAPFQVADPRPPTAVVNLTTPDWVRGRGGAGGAGKRCQQGPGCKGPHWGTGEAPRRANTP